MVARAQEVLTERGQRENEQEWRALRRGWFVGGAGFRDWLMEEVDKVVRRRRRHSYVGENLRRHDEQAAERLLVAGLERLGLDLESAQTLRANAPEKQALLWLVKTHTVVGDAWLLGRLQAGHRSNVSRAVRAFHPPRDRRRKSFALRLHKCTD